MTVKYQVFVSSTYTDLKEERLKIFNNLLNMNCMVSGMEYFPATDLDQFEYIKRMLNDCDYYVLIIGGKYGTVTSSGKSYTELEYDFAVKEKIPVLAFIHDSPETLPNNKTEDDHEIKEKLKIFCDKVKSGRIVKFWKDSNDLAAQVVLALNSAFTTYKAVGWVKANSIASEDLLLEINTLRKENQELKAKYSDENSVVNFSQTESSFDLSTLITVKAVCFDYNVEESNTETLTYADLFSLVGVRLLENAALPVWGFKSTVGKQIWPHYSKVEMEQRDLDDIFVIFLRCGLIELFTARGHDFQEDYKAIKITKKGLETLANTTLSKRRIGE